MYLTEMIKVLPTQSGRYLAPTAALSHVLKRQQHRPKIRHRLQEKKHSKVNQGSLCQVLERCPASASPREPQTRVPVHKRARHSGSGTQQVHGRPGTPVGPKHQIPAPARCSLAELRTFSSPGFQQPCENAFICCTLKEDKECGPLPDHPKQKSVLSGAFQGYSAPSQGKEALFRLHLCLLPTLGAFIHIP